MHFGGSLDDFSRSAVLNVGFRFDCMTAFALSTSKFLVDTEETLFLIHALLECE